MLFRSGLENYGAKIVGLLGEKFTLCEKYEDIDKGAIVRNGRIEINCRLSALVLRLMDTDYQEVSNILLGG